MRFYIGRYFGIKWKRKKTKGKSKQIQDFIVYVLVLPHVKVNRNQNLFLSFPQRYNHGNDHSFPQRKEFRSLGELVKDGIKITLINIGIVGLCPWQYPEIGYGAATRIKKEARSSKMYKIPSIFFSMVNSKTENLI